MVESSYVPVDEVRAQYELTDRQLRRRIASEGITIFKAPSDRRLRLLRVEDVPRLVNPIPVNRSPDRPDAA